MDENIRNGYVKVDKFGEYYLFNYTPKTVYNRYWNDTTLQCRGLIKDKDGVIIARPFDKFFNLNEVESTRLENLPDSSYTVFKKYDGSLGILWSDKHGNKRIATRGCFTSPQAEFATELWNRRYRGLYYENLTLLFEIIYPGDKHVVDYGKEERLVIIGGRVTDTGRYLSHNELKSLGYDDIVESVPASLEEIIESSYHESGTEGYVVQFHTNPPLFIKIKTSEYLRISKSILGFSKKKVLENINSWETYIVNLPEEHRELAEEWKEEIDRFIGSSYQYAIHVYQLFLEQGYDKRDFAIETRDPSHHFYHIRPFVFSLYDDKDNIKELLLKCTSL